MKSLVIILIPALLVAALGHVVVLRMMGIPPGYSRLIMWRMALAFWRDLLAFRGGACRRR